MGLFTKGQSKTLPLKTVKFMLGDDHIFLRELTSKELLHYQSKMGDKETTNIDYLYDIIARCAVDEDCKPIFASVDEVKNELNVGLSTLTEMHHAISRVSGLEGKN
jgi:hypothetical protein